MKINMDVQLIGLQGEPIKRGKEEVTLKLIAMNALLLPVEKDDEKKKYEKWELYKKIKNERGNEVYLTVSEIAMIKELIGKHEPPLIMGQCWDLIEGGKQE